MLYWPWLISISYSVTLCVDPFIPLYLFQFLQLNTVTISAFLSGIYTLRLISGVWSVAINFRPDLYEKTIVALVSLSSLCYISLFTISASNSWTILKWCLLALCLVVNGLFYQPIGTLVNSAIMKILGDYRVMFYSSYLRWGDTTRFLVTSFIGIALTSMGEAYFGHVLMIVWTIGAVLLSVFALSKSNAVLPANTHELKISDDQAPLLLKSANILGIDQSSIFNTPYKPYSIFGEQLSRITEEDASALDTILTTENSLRQMYSYGSNVSSFYSRRINANEGLEYYRSQSTDREDTEEQQHTVHVYALSLLPLPGVMDPLVALFSSPEDEAADEELFPRPMYHDHPLANPLLSKSKNRRLQTLAWTMLFLGVTKALLNTFLFVYLYHILQISIMEVSFLIMIQIASESTVHFSIEKWFIHKMNLKLITTLMHAVLIFCSVVYLFLETKSVTTRTLLILLQSLQGIAFQTIWSSAVNNIHVVAWSQYERMKERSKASALFSSCGPAIGTAVAGIALQHGLESYHFLFKICIVFSVSSLVVSLGWVASD